MDTPIRVSYGLCFTNPPGYFIALSDPRSLNVHYSAAKICPDVEYEAVHTQIAREACPVQMLTKAVSLLRKMYLGIEMDIETITCILSFQRHVNMDTLITTEPACLTQCENHFAPPAYHECSESSDIK